MFLWQRLTAKRRDDVHLRVEQDIDEHLDLGKLLPQQRRHGCPGHCAGELIKAELEFVRQFHVVRARSILGGEGRLAQTRLEFVRRKRQLRYDFALQLFFKFVQRCLVSFEVTLQFPVIRLVWKRIETVQPDSLRRSLTEGLLSVAPNAQPPVKQCRAEQDANSRNKQKRAKRSVLLKPFHAAKIFFTTEDAENKETREVFDR